MKVRRRRTCACDRNSNASREFDAQLPALHMSSHRSAPVCASCARLAASCGAAAPCLSSAIRCPSTSNDKEYSTSLPLVTACQLRRQQRHRAAEPQSACPWVGALLQAKTSTHTHARWCVLAARMQHAAGAWRRRGAARAGAAKRPGRWALTPVGVELLHCCGPHAQTSNLLIGSASAVESRRTDARAHTRCGRLVERALDCNTLYVCRSARPWRPEYGFIHHVSRSTTPLLRRSLRASAISLCNSAAASGHTGNVTTDQATVPAL